MLFEVDWITADSNGTSDYVGIAQAARAGRASRVGSKAGRIVRILRIIRLVRIGKLYKQAKASAERESHARVHPTGRRSSIEILGEPPHDMAGHASSGVIETQGDNPQKLLISPSSRLMASPSELATSGRTVRSDDPPMEDEFLVDDDTATVPKESRVGRKLSDITTKRVIVLVLLMLMLLPLFAASFFFAKPNSYDYGLDHVVEMYGTPGFE
eukprot:CAMPEP_0114984850 /NCGR_PEP_ID=MMETSP0216-20121206/7517_1 /TAXON_ID=223996 /ORGANISM="Protocruzia adherens, Strain Boccale" /LENGTH=212 /DNA_ID=CAMNT_0002347055 /DNA_START=258 /DNA_END=893 /DNA_ORIENTATION=+